MPVLKEKKLLFVHIPKTGGTTLETCLGMNREECLFSRHAKKYREGLFAPQHLSYGMLTKYGLCPGVEHFKKITIVRNPYRRAISSFFWNTQSSQFDAKKFHGYVKRAFRRPKRDHEMAQTFYFDVDYDYVARTESLDDDMLAIREMFDLDFEYTPQKVFKQAPSTPELLSEVLPETISLMNRIFEDDFRVLGYEKRAPLED